MPDRAVVLHDNNEFNDARDIHYHEATGYDYDDLVRIHHRHFGERDHDHSGVSDYNGPAIYDLDFSE